MRGAGCCSGGWSVALWHTLLGQGPFATLAASLQIAESHGGTIHVESRPGTGATFILQLPVGQQPLAGDVAGHPAPA